MATVTKYPTSDTAVSGSWSNPTNVQADDGSVASITRGTTKNSQDDRRQGGYGFDASIPSGSTINSVQIEVEHRVQTTSNLCFLENFASISGVDGAVNSDDLEPTTLTARTYASYARPGGGSWTRDDLLDGTFTTTIRARNGNNGTSNTWEWDYIRVTVDYTAPAADLSREVTAEDLKIADTLSQPLLITFLTVPAETVTVTDTATASLDPLQSGPSESLKIVDLGHGSTALLGTLHIQDVVSATLTPLETIVTESLKVVDTITAQIALGAQVADESLRLSDTVLGRQLDPLLASASEAVSITDAATPAMQWAVAVTDEALHVMDAASASQSSSDLSASVQEALKVVDLGQGRTALLGTLRIQDTVTAALSGGADLSASVQETLRLSDGGPDQTWDTLRLSDVVSAQMQPHTLLTASVTETLKLSESITTVAQLGVILTDTLRLSDRVAILAVSINEQMLLSDVGRGATQILGTIRISDTVQATVSGFLGAAPTEALRIVDTVSVQRSVLEAVLAEVAKIGYTSGLNEAELVQDEWVRVTEILTAAMGVPTDRFASVQETLRIGESLTLARTLETPVTEPLVLAEQLSASRDIEATLSESVRCADAVTAIQDQLVEVIEGLTVVDQTPIGRHDPLEIELTETSRIAEETAAALVSGDLAVLAGPEAVKITDPLTANQDHSIKIADDFIFLREEQDIEGPPLLVEVGAESLKLGESVDGREFDPIEIVLDGEDLLLGDGPPTSVTALTVAVEDVVRISDADLTPAMQLAANPGGEDDLTVAVFEECRLAEGPKPSFYAVRVSFIGTFAPGLSTIGTVGRISVRGTVE